jgi:hypothetical protein
MARRLVLIAGVVAATAIGFGGGYIIGEREHDGEQSVPAKATKASGHVFVATRDDYVRVPSTSTECLVTSEAGMPRLVCVHVPKSRYQVYFYRDEVQVWKRGVDGPVFTGGQ